MTSFTFPSLEGRLQLTGKLYHNYQDPYENQPKLNASSTKSAPKEA
jgi:hypothetical protein